MHFGSYPDGRASAYMLDTLLFLLLVNMFPATGDTKMPADAMAYIHLFAIHKPSPIYIRVLLRYARKE